MHSAHQISMTTSDKILVEAPDAASLCSMSRRMWMRLNKDEQIPAPRKLRSKTLWDVAELRAWSAAGCPERAKWNP